MEEIVVEEVNVHTLDPKSADALRLTELVHQLSSSHAEKGTTGIEYYRDHSVGGKVFVIRNESVIVASGCYALTKEKGEGNPVSFIAVPDSVAFIHGIIADQSMRGRGYGTTLMQHIISNIQTQNISCIQLTSNPSRESARRLYLKIGFKEVGTVIWPWIDPKTGKHQITLLFELHLGRGAAM